MSENQNRSNESIFSGEVDPEIAELIGIEEEAPQKDKEEQPDFNELFGEEQPEKKAPEEVDLKKESFPEIKSLEGKPKPYFKDKNFYKKVLSGEGDEAKRFHDLLSKFLKAEDTQDRSLYRQRLIPAYWNLAQRIASRIYRDLSTPKQLMLRFGVVLPNLISKEQRDMISKVIFENETGEPVHYIDEWLRMVAEGKVSTSATDETKTLKKNENQKILTQLEKAKGQRDVQMGLVKGKIGDIETLESQLKDSMKTLLKHERRPGFDDLIDSFSAAQKDALSEINEILRKLSNADKELSSLYNDLEDAIDRYKELEEKAEEFGDTTGVDNQEIIGEFNTVRQMAKLCVGRQGNHFPILMKQYFRPNISDIAVRENVIREMAAVEEVDPDLFKRTFKRQTNRIVPYVILTPCYGDKGICWEPFERYNKATSRGRIAIPMYPKDVGTAVIEALADLRWQVAKEKAQHYWMEEGLTGKYYQWFSERRRKGDVRESFIQDYKLWIQKESVGTQKLEREVRGIFWRNIPFPQEIKDKLKNRGFVYNELYKKDSNIAMSDGY
jgi:hypothetical protein